MFIKSILLVGIATLSPVVGAISTDLPSKVFRVDSTPPDIVFRDGFYSPGYDDNLISHVNGGSCDSVNPTSNFISTLTDVRSIATIIREHQREHETIYVYTIRPENYFYNAARSIESFLQFENSPSPLTLNALETSSKANEWVAVSRIAANTIEGVTEIYRDAPTRYFINSNYVNKSPDANPNIYHTYRPDTYRQARFYSFSPKYGKASISACMATCFRSESKHDARPQYCRAPYVIPTALMLNAISR